MTIDPMSIDNYIRRLRDRASEFEIDPYDMVEWRNVIRATEKVPMQTLSDRTLGPWVFL